MAASRFSDSYDEPLAELIIHPGKDLAQMQAFSATGQRRLANYLFFSGEAWRDLQRRRDLPVITWDEV